MHNLKERIMRNPRLLSIYLIVCLILTIHAGFANAAGKNIIVAAMDMSPLFIFNNNDTPQGMIPDLLSEIALQENWNLSYRKFRLPELLEFLQTNHDPDIRIVTITAYNEGKSKYLTFTRRSILDVCGNLIAFNNTKLKTLNDLNHKTVGVVSRAEPAAIFKETISTLDINCNILDFTDLEHMLKYLTQHPDSLILLDNFTFSYNKLTNKKFHDLESMLMILPSFSMRFAGRKNLDDKIIKRINFYINKWKGEPNSPYIQIYEKWNIPEERHNTIFQHLTPFQLTLIPTMVIALLLWIFLLRYRIRKNTLKIKDKEQDLQATLMSIADGVIVSDTTGHILEINRAAKNMLAINNTEDLTQFDVKSDIMLLDNNSSTALENPISSIIDKQTHLTHTRNCVLRNKCGHNYIISFTASPIFVLNILKGVVFVFKDITEEAKNTQRIQRSERELSAMIESVNEAIFVFDKNLILQQVNKYGHEILLHEHGFSDIIGKSCFDICFAKYYNNNLCPLKNAQENGKSSIITNESKSGKIYQIKTTPILNNNSEAISIIQSLIDITELKIKERALKTSEKNYRMLIENQSDIIIKLDTQGNTMFVTKSFTTFFEISSDESVEHSFFDFVNPEDRAIAKKALQKLYGQISTVRIELRHNTSKGIHWISWQISKVIGDDEQTEYFIATGRDITESKIAREQLKHVQKLEAIGQLAGGIAHDFNNMLGGIVGFAELIIMQSPAKKIIREYSKNIIDTSEKAGELTQQLLAFARKGKSSSTPIDVHSSIKRAIDILKRSIKKNVRIELFLNAKNSMIIGDPTQIQNIILNLGINARDAIGDENEGVFTIETTTISLSAEFCEQSDFKIKPQDYILIIARDNGSGMNKEVLEHIFEPFFTTKEVGKGTGLGLASIYGAVTSHAGAITATSEPGQGAEFNIFLPLLEDFTTNSDEEITTDVLKISDRGAHKIILVIDDEEIIRMVAKSLLEGMGYSVLLANDGKEGLEVYQTNQDIISAVILDVIMPRMGGKETLKQLQLLNPACKVIMASGFSQTEKANDFIALGAQEFIHKPYRQKELFATLKRVFKTPENQ